MRVEDFARKGFFVVKVGHIWHGEMTGGNGDIVELACFLAIFSHGYNCELVVGKCDVFHACVEVECAQVTVQIDIALNSLLL